MKKAKKHDREQALAAEHRAWWAEFIDYGY